MMQYREITSVYAPLIGFCCDHDFGADENVDASGYHHGHWDDCSLPSQAHLS
jgi:hypothetical protein